MGATKKKKKKKVAALILIGEIFYTNALGGIVNFTELLCFNRMHVSPKVRILAHLSCGLPVHV